MDSDQFKILKIVVNSIVSLSVANVARKVIENNVNPNSIQVKITTFVIGDLVFTYIWKDVDTRMEQLRDWVSSIKQSVEEGKKEKAPIVE